MNATAVTVTLLAFVLTEPCAALLHRHVMHRTGERWHRSHHLPPAHGAVELNDRYPIVFAGITMVAFAVGTSVDALCPLVWVATGVTLWGVGYLVIHDVCVHGRGVGRPLGERGYIGYVRRAHRVHHLTATAPYGFLFPIVGRAARDRVGALDATRVMRRDRSGRPVAALTATSSFRTVGTDARREKTS